MMEYIALIFMITIHELGHALAGAYDGILIGFEANWLGPGVSLSKPHKNASRYLWGIFANLLTWPLIAGMTPIFNFIWWVYPSMILAMGCVDILLFSLLFFKIGKIQGDKIVSSFRGEGRGIT